MEGYTSEAFDFFQRSTRNNTFKMPAAHFHAHNELYCLIKGKTQYCIENEIYFLEPGDMIFVPSGSFHQTASAASGDMERVLIIFNDDSVGDAFKPFVEQLRQNKHIRIPKDRQAACRSIFHLMEEEAQNRNDAYPLMQRLLLCQLLLIISRHRLKDLANRYSPSCQAIRDAVHYIGANYQRDWSLDELCFRYSLSRSYFSKLFKKVTGTGVNDYINTVRIDAARDMLAADPSVSISYVAQMCGFHDSDYFAMVFKRIIGATPKKYAMNLRNKQYQA